MVDQVQGYPPNVEIIDKEHVEDKILDSSCWLLPGNDVLIGVLDLVDGAALGDEHLDSVHIVQKLRSFKLWFWNFIENFFLVVEYR